MTGVSVTNQYSPWIQPQWQNNTWNTNWNANNFSTPMFGANSWSPYTTFGWGNNSTTSSTSSYKTIEQIEKEKAENNKKINEALKQKYWEANQSTVFKGLTKKEEQKLIEYSAKSKEYVEDLGSSLAMGAGMGVALPNLRNVTHPFSAAKSTFSKNSVTNQMFKDVVKTDLWKKEAPAMQKAYELMQKAEVRANKWNWQGWFKRGYTKTEFDDLKNIMETALQSGDKNQILEATAKLQNADSIKQGKISKVFDWVKGKFGIAPSQAATVTDKITNTEAITNGAKELAKSTSHTTFKASLKTSVGGKIGCAFALLSLLSEWQYISAAFKEDTATGFKQLGQSIVKAGSSWGGYVLGDALGKWGGAKLGAMIGTAICPGLGTAIGAAAGVVSGTICGWGLRKLANWAVGDNIANELIAKKEVEQASTPEGQAAYLQQLIAQAEADKNIDQETLTIINKIKNMQAEQMTQAEQTQGLQMTA